MDCGRTGAAVPALGAGIVTTRYPCGEITAAVNPSMMTSFETFRAVQRSLREEPEYRREAEPERLD
jgi:hypothetical protein